MSWPTSYYRSSWCHRGLCLHWWPCYLQVVQTLIQLNSIISKICLVLFLWGNSAGPAASYCDGNSHVYRSLWSPSKVLTLPRMTSWACWPWCRLWQGPVLSHSCWLPMVLYQSILGPFHVVFDLQANIARSDPSMHWGMYFEWSFLLLEDLFGNLCHP